MPSRDLVAATVPLTSWVQAPETPTVRKGSGDDGSRTRAAARLKRSTVVAGSHLWAEIHVLAAAEWLWSAITPHHGIARFCAYVQWTN